MKILVTGASGFIGFHLVKSLLDSGYIVVGLDNINDYYDVHLKYARMAELGVDQSKAEPWGVISQSSTFSNFSFIRMSLENRIELPKLFKKEKFDVVCNLAAQAGVRYSLENPEAYMDSNMVGFLNILECCRHYAIKHLIYASSSSVYGLNKKVPFETDDRVDYPISLYAATKKSNELFAYTYSHLFAIPTTGLRFFTVYGPWGRPDMAYYTFTKSILEGRPIPIFNNGDLSRDFTYIDDIVRGLNLIVQEGFKPSKELKTNAAIYNIGRGKPVNLMDFVNTIGQHLNKKARINMLPMQDGDVYTTWANTEALQKNYGYTPKIDLNIGVKKFIDWYTAYH
ncbi:NAD-dependent epimerase/dehydratase family protein [Maribacter sp. 4G9]|uniref:NAD-dependent epimerase/dehydratase family protein n=1 Tax=Maribacter sp. 4G9 TaxID=1889777 RepID=UPI000C148265|nr:NAD-dependent epimerase/dehydratase family protein [Maribacter sp. 4G9]PIB23010.1 capsule biosynthesis protein CapI [Maribacter sp. 4G9]